MDPPETFERQQLLTKPAESPNGGTPSTHPLCQTLFLHVSVLLRWVVPLVLILAMDIGLREAFESASIEFPSALFGMFCIFAVLIVLDCAAPYAALGLVKFFDPGLMFIQRWLPLFYIPYLVVLPISIKDIPPSSGIKICFIIVGGWVATLCVSGFTAIAIRTAMKTELVNPEPMEKPSPFSTIEVLSWTGVFLVSFVPAIFFPTALGTGARTCILFYLASTVLGYMVGSRLPSKVKMVFHPIIFSVIFANLAACAYGFLSKQGYNAVLGFYLTKSSSDPGAGDILSEFLGSVILSFAFSMFKQRKEASLFSVIFLFLPNSERLSQDEYDSHSQWLYRLMKRHAAEIFTSVIVSTLFSLYSTALVGRLVALEPSLTVSILPRCITVALALNIMTYFEGANLALTAAVVVATGLIGANFVQSMLNILRLRDPIARGIAAASSSHGLATAALSAEEPEALPFSAIAYALTGIFGSLLCSIPAFRQSLLAITG